MDTVTFNNQIWGNKNLETTKFQNGDDIFLAQNVEEWKNAINNNLPACCNYNFDENLGVIYGKIYNWYVISDNRNVCPPKFKIPENDDWMSLIQNIELKPVEVSFGYTPFNGADRLMSKEYWDNNSTKGSDDYGFSALPGGCMSKNASFLNIGNQSMWWSSTNKSDIQAQVFSISGLNNNIMQSDARKQSYFGCYIRCVIE